MWKKAEQRPRGARCPMETHWVDDKSQQKSRGFSGTTVLFVPGPVYL